MFYKSLAKIALLVAVALGTLKTFQPHEACAVQIIAIVGSCAITDYDLKQRSKIVALIHNLDYSSKDVMSALERQTLTMMIDEKMRMEYISNLTQGKARIENEMVDKIIQHYITQAKIGNLENLKRKLAKMKIDWDFFYETMRDEMLWTLFVNFSIIPNIHVSGEEAKQRAILRGIDIANDAAIAEIKHEIAMEKSALTVKKIITQMRQLHVVEPVIS